MKNRKFVRDTNIDRTVMETNNEVDYSKLLPLSHNFFRVTSLALMLEKICYKFYTNF